MRRLAAIIGLLALGAGAFAALGAGSQDTGDYRVRAIFDNASFVVEGLDVKVSGVRVGAIDALDVTSDNRAAVTLKIEDPAFQDFRRDAHCRIRPASLIGEEYVDCQPTGKRVPGSEPPPELERTETGEYLLPVENTSASVDLDLIADAMRRPERERLALILGELGVAVAGRGAELNEVIRRANPALRETNRVLALLAEQNDVLADLARDSDRIMRPLARERESVTGFIENAGDVAQATAERREALQANLERFPRFLQELRPTMARLEKLATQTTPVLADLRASAPQIDRLVRQMGPFSEAATPALRTLGEAAEPGIPAIRASLPILRDLRTFSRGLRPVARTLDSILVSFERNDGLPNFMDYVFLQVMAVNGFDAFGHFLRAGLLVNSCITYTTTPVAGCEAKFRQPSSQQAVSARAAAAAQGEKAVKQQRLAAGERAEDVLTPQERARARRERQRLLDGLKAEALESAKAQAREPDAPIRAPEPAPEGVALMDYLFGGEE